MGVNDTKKCFMKLTTSGRNWQLIYPICQDTTRKGKNIILVLFLDVQFGQGGSGFSAIKPFYP
jgi:hypothetical protein